MLASTTEFTLPNRIATKWNVPVESRNDDGWTALHLTSYKGNAETIRVLLEAGANSKADDGSGKTPLDWAKTRGKKENVEVLEAALKG